MTELKPQKLLFGLSLGVAQKIKDPVEAEILHKFPEMQTVCRYRKEGIYQYLKEQENTLVIMEENLQGGSSYTIQELQRLTDLGNSRIIFLMDSGHSGDDYVKALYYCGICDALYLEEATPEEVLKLVYHARGNEAARKYYGIQVLRDAEKSGSIVNEGLLGAYLEFMEEEKDRGELGEKYRFVSTRLSAEENRILAVNITGEAAHSLKGNEVFGFYRGGGREGRRHIRKKKKAEAAENLPVQREPVLKEQEKPPCVAVYGCTSEKDEDEMSCAMERFWEAGKMSIADSGQDNGAEQMVLLGEFLKEIDK